MKIILTILFIVFMSGCGSTYPKLQKGDIVFQDLDCGELCDAIEKVTIGINGKSFSHVAIVSRVDRDGKAFVIEAYDGVKEIPFEELVKRSPKITVGRLHPEYAYLIPVAVDRAYKLIGKPYDSKFMLNNDAYYCSELIYEIFKYDDKGKFVEVFPLNIMTFDDPNTHKTMAVWAEYFNKLGVPVPEGKLGINPGAISRSERLSTL